MKILVTGASGLLGTDIVLELAASGHEITKNSFSERPGFVAADISTPKGMSKLTNLNWDCIVHTTAARDPDSCEKDKDAAFKLNVLASEKLARAAAKKKAKFIFISTDYVFSGDNPPYKETDVPSPVNYYGETKFEAEKRILSICPDAIIIRVSILYGINAGLKASPLLYSSLKAIESKAKVFIDDAIIRYPVYTGDVAKALNFLLSKNASGIFHFSSDDKTTKYKMAKEMASVLGKDSSHINPLETVPAATLARRPLDSHLDLSKIRSLGFPSPAFFRERISSFKDRLKF
jgi:dTDP-4-dehydrorhamnose reductase